MALLVKHLMMLGVLIGLFAFGIASPFQDNLGKGEVGRREVACHLHPDCFTLHPFNTHYTHDAPRYTPIVQLPNTVIVRDVHITPAPQLQNTVIVRDEVFGTPVTTIITFAASPKCTSTLLHHDTLTLNPTKTLWAHTRTTTVGVPSRWGQNPIQALNARIKPTMPIVHLPRVALDDVHTTFITRPRPGGSRPNHTPTHGPPETHTIPVYPTYSHPHYFTNTYWPTRLGERAEATVAAEACRMNGGDCFKRGEATEDKEACRMNGGDCFKRGEVTEDKEACRMNGGDCFKRGEATEDKEACRMNGGDCF